MTKHWTRHKFQSVMLNIFTKAINYTLISFYTVQCIHLLYLSDRCAQLVKCFHQSCLAGAMSLKKFEDRTISLRFGYVPNFRDHLGSPLCPGKNSGMGTVI